MAFDPDAYLAEPSSKSAFDPDAFLSGGDDSEGSFMPDFLTGADRSTPQTESLPELYESGLLAGEDQARAGLVSQALLATTDPNEIAKIVTANFPNVGVTYNLDAQGKPFPILVNNKTGAATQINRPGVSGMDVLQGLGLAAAFTPAGRAGSLLGAGARAGATEAAIQGVQELSGGEFDPEDVALSAGLGVAGKGIEDVAGATFRAIKGRPKSELLDAARQADIPLATSDVMPPQTFAGKTAVETAEKIPFAGTGAMREAQQRFRSEAVESVGERYGQYSYKEIIDSLKDKSDRIKSAAGNVLERSGAQLDELGEVPLTRTAIVIPEVMDELSKPGVIKSTRGIEDIQTLLDALTEGPQSFTMLKENRTAFRDIIKGAESKDRTQLRGRTKALLERAEKAMTDDMRAMARENLSPMDFARWEKANAVYANEATKLQKSKIKRLLDSGEVTPEVAENMLFSRKPSEVKQLYVSLGSKGRANARAAIVNKVFDNLSRRQAGLTPNSFASEMKKMGLQTSTFFKGEEAKQLTGLIKVLDATRRAQDAAITTPTGQTLLGVASGGAVVADPVTAIGLGGTAGVAARIYESAPVRNALLRLASIPKGSTKFEQALKEAQAAMTAAAQAIREREDKQDMQ